MRIKPVMLSSLSMLILVSNVFAADVIKEISVKNAGSGPVDEGFVLAHITLKKGVEVDQASISKDTKALLAAGRFSWVSMEIEPVGGGVRVVVSVRNKFKLANPISVKGASYLGNDRIIDLIGLEVGDFVDDQTMGVKVQQVVGKYREEYYPDVAVTFEIKEIDKAQGKADVAVMVNEGRRQKIQYVDFKGNTVVSSSSLMKYMKQPVWWNPFWWLRKHRYEESEVESARAEILNEYKNRGYLDAKVEITQVVRDNEGISRFLVNITEGPLYKFGKISMSGVKLFPNSKELGNCLLAKQGKPASDEVIRYTVQAIQDYYGSRGYVDCFVRPLRNVNSTEHVEDADFVVSEGIQVKIRNIRIEGNTKTKDKVIRRELLVSPGDIYDEVRVRRSERIISNLEYFKTVRSYPSKSILSDERDLVFEVEEKPTGQFMISAGFSSIDQVMGMVEVSQGNFDLFGWPNFTGGGEKLKLSTQFGSTRKLYEINFVEPWFLDRKLSLGVNFYLSQFTYTDYDIDRKGVSLTLGKALTFADRVEFQYSIEKERLADIADTNAYINLKTGAEYYFSQEPETLKSSVQLTLIHDTRNHPFLPSKGNRTSIFGSISGTFLGGDTDIYQLGFRTSEYIPLWFDHVLSLRGRCEVVDSYDDTANVPITDRLFIGGGRTVRGFNYRDVGPKVVREMDVTNGVSATGFFRPVGGKSLAMATVEYTIPVVSSVRIALFYDIGNAWQDAYEFDFDNLAMSTGVGLRLDLPGFPIKIDYGWVIRKDDPLTDKQPWIIWIGPDY